MSDERWMRRALELAARGRGAVEPNPMVGAVVVRDGVVIGEGWHDAYGGPHAEVHALQKAGEAARGATLYATLEPCCHFGKTPPCTGAVLAAGIARVVAAMRDPFPQVAGGGEALLRGAGVAVEMGLCEQEAVRLNAPYLKLLGRKMPYVHAKWAMTLDGKIATRSGDSKWISNETSRRRVHEIRGRMDAIVVGIGTALADDPLLTARPPGPRTAVRVVLDSQARLPLTSRLVVTSRTVPTWVLCSQNAPEQARLALTDAGCEVVQSPQPGQPSVIKLLTLLGERRFTNILVEGGGEVLGSFLDATALDEVHVFVAPRLAGGAEARGPVLGRGVDRMADALTLDGWQVEETDGDVYLHGWKYPTAEGERVQ